MICVEERSSLFPARSRIWRDLRRKPECDVCLYGAGRDYAVLAQLCALHGLRTVWLSPGDFFEQEDLTLAGMALSFEVQPRFPERFIRRITLHDRFCGITRTRQGAILRTVPLLTERLLASRQEGALTLNHIPLCFIQRSAKGMSRLRISEHGETIDLTASIAIAGRNPARAAGITMLFREGCPQPLRTRGIGSSTIWLPAPEGSVVAVRHLRPDRARSLLEQFASSFGLQKKLWEQVTKPSEMYSPTSSYPMPAYSPLEAERVAGEMFRNLCRRISYSGPIASLGSRPLPGDAPGVQVSFTNQAAESGIPDTLASQVFERLGGAVRYLEREQHEYELLDGKYLKGEVALGVEVFQAYTSRDIALRLGDMIGSLSPQVTQIVENIPVLRHASI